MNTLLEVSGVTVSFDGFRAINNLSFQIADAELRAVIGRFWTSSLAKRDPILDISCGVPKTCP